MLLALSLLPSAPLQGAQEGESITLLQPLTAKKLKKINWLINVSTDTFNLARTFSSFLLSAFGYSSFFASILFSTSIMWGASFVISIALRTIAFFVLKSNETQGEIYRKKAMGYTLFIDVFLLAIALMLGGISAWLTHHQKFNFFIYKNDSDGKKSILVTRAFITVGFGWAGSVAYLISIIVKYTLYKRIKV